MSFRMTAFLAAGTAFALGSSASAYAQATSQTCALSSYCALVTNTSSGPAFHGKGNSGYGVVGNSTSGGGVLGSSASGLALAPGIEGESTNNDANDAAAAFGLAAYLNSATTPAGTGVFAFGYDGLYAQTLAPGTSSSLGYGVLGFDNAASGNAYNVAVAGRSTYGVGVLGAANGSPNTTTGVKNSLPVGVYAVADSTKSTNAVGIEVESNSYPIEVRNTSSSTTQQIVEIDDSNYFISGTHDGTGSFSVDTSGNVVASGTVTSTGFTTDARAASGAVRTAYAPRAASPTVEDTGEAQLVAGSAAVRIDVALADVIDMRAGYRVLLTPDGDCKGLYVAQKTRYGFLVRELQGGRSTLGFDYRIVAKPLADDGQRLAVVRPQAGAFRSASAPGFKPAPVARPLDPKAALLQKLGPAGYAKAVRAFEQREAAL